jgi:predicted GIY-YIG superfamily endonuclease
MSLPSIVFIVANDKREVFVGYTKDLEVALSVMEGDEDYAARGFDRLVYKQEFLTVREAMARVAEINAMSPNARRRFVEQYNPTWTPLKETAVFPPPHGKDVLAKPCQVIVVMDDSGDLRLDLTTDLAATLILLRARIRRAPNPTGRMPKLVFSQALPNVAAAKARLKELKRMTAGALRYFVGASNAGWIDLTPPHLLAPASGMGSLPSLRQRPGDGPDSAGGVTADLPGGPNGPVGVRTGSYEEPWPPVEE